MLLAAARHEPKIRAWVIKEADKAITRDVDRKRLEPLLAELKTLGTNNQHQPDNAAVAKSGADTTLP